jgi:ABC-type transport system involved in cytochrome c biogenesis permease component
MLTITSLLSVLLLTFHLADDIRRGFEPGGLTNLVGTVIISVVWLYGILVLAERRSGYIIMLLLSLFSLVVPYVHMTGRGVGVTSKIANFSGHFFFVWTLLAIGVLGLFSAILAARGLWSLSWRRQPR